MRGGKGSAWCSLALRWEGKCEWILIASGHHQPCPYCRIQSLCMYPWRMPQLNYAEFEFEENLGNILRHSSIRKRAAVIF